MQLVVICMHSSQQCFVGEVGGDFICSAMKCRLCAKPVNVTHPPQLVKKKVYCTAH